MKTRRAHRRLGLGLGLAGLALGCVSAPRAAPAPPPKGEPAMSQHDRDDTPSDNATPAARLQRLAPWSPEREQLLRRLDAARGQLALSPLRDGDWGWLEEAAREARVVFLGEEHYRAATHALRDELLWRLNARHGFRLLLIEEPYSLTGPMDRYLSLKSEPEAARYLQDVLATLVPDQGLLHLLARIRRHNQTAAAPIRVAAYDLEHRPEQARRYVIEPYFHAHALPLPATFGAAPLSLDDWDEALPALREALAGLGADAGEGPFPRALVVGVVRNLADTVYARMLDPQNGQPRRQRALVRNLTDPAFLGPRVSTQRALVHCGWYHALRRVPLAPEDLYLREAAYLDQAFAPTRGKVLSLRADSLGLRFDPEDLEVDVEALVLRGTGFARLLEEARADRDAGLLAWGQDVRPFEQPPLLEHWLLRAAGAFDDEAAARRWWRVERVPWRTLQQLAREAGDAELAAQLKRSQHDYQAVDAVLLRRSSRPIRGTLRQAQRDADGQ